MSTVKLWILGAVAAVVLALTIGIAVQTQRLSGTRTALDKANVQVQGLTQAVSTLQAREKALVKAVQHKENKSAEIEIRYRTKIKLVPTAVPDGGASLSAGELQWLRNRTTSPASSEAAVTP